MAKESKQDGFRGGTLEEKVQDREVGTAASDDSASVMDTLKGGVEAVKGAFSAVTGGVGKAWSTVGEWKDKGVCVVRFWHIVYICHTQQYYCTTRASPDV